MNRMSGVSQPDLSAKLIGGQPRHSMKGPQKIASVNSSVNYSNMPNYDV